MAWLTIAVEGEVDAAVARVLATVHGHDVVAVHISRGKDSLDRRLGGYNNAARFLPWLVLRDLDHDGDCPASLVSRICPSPSEHLVLRVAVREVESWILADRSGVAGLLGLKVRNMPQNPDELEDPKGTLVDLARLSPRRSVREDLVPTVGFSATVGPGYNRRLIEFVGNTWEPDVAAASSQSLARCRRALASVR